MLEEGGAVVPCPTAAAPSPLSLCEETPPYVEVEENHGKVTEMEKGEGMGWGYLRCVASVPSQLHTVRKGTQSCIFVVLFLPVGLGSRC